MKVNAAKKRKTMYAPGVVIDDTLWIECKNGNLIGTMTMNVHDAHLYVSKAGAFTRATLIASRFPRCKKVKPVVSRVSVEV